MPTFVKLAEGQEQLRGVRMMIKMRDDLAATAVHDTVINGPDGLRAILTMASEFFGDVTRSNLREGVFTAIGKVTRILDEGTRSTFSQGPFSGRLARTRAGRFFSLLRAPKA
jgi:hypothetical protein